MVSMGKTSYGPLSVLLQLSLIFMIISIPAAAQLWRHVEMEAPSEVEVPVEPGSNNRVHLYANVSIPYEGTGYEYVWLSTNCTLGWATVRLQMCVINLSSDIPKEVDIFIEIPRGTSSYERPVVDIFASKEEPPTNDALWIHRINVTVLPYYRFSIESDRSVDEIMSGGEMTFPLAINNTGNIDDNYTMMVENTEELEQEGITVELTDSIAVREGEQREVKLRVNTEGDTEVMPHTIWIRTESLGAEGRVWEEYPLILSVTINPIRILIVPSAIILGILGIVIGVYFLSKKKKGV